MLCWCFKEIFHGAGITTRNALTGVACLPDLIDILEDMQGYACGGLQMP